MYSRRLRGYRVQKSVKEVESRIEDEVIRNYRCWRDDHVLVLARQVRACRVLYSRLRHPLDACARATIPLCGAGSQITFSTAELVHTVTPALLPCLSPARALVQGLCSALVRWLDVRGAGIATTSNYPTTADSTDLSFRT